MFRQPSEVESITAQETLVSPTERIALKRVLSYPVDQRTHAELLPVHRVLQKVEFVAKLELNVQEHLANIVFYEHYEPFTNIFVEVFSPHEISLLYSWRQGEIGKNFYIIVSGSVAVQKQAGWTAERHKRQSSMRGY